MKRSLKAYFSTLVLLPALFLAQTPLVAAQPTAIVGIEEQQVIAHKEEIKNTLHKGIIINKSAKFVAYAALIATGGYLVYKLFKSEPKNQSQYILDDSISGPYRPGSSVVWTAEEKAGVLTTLANVNNRLTQKPVKSYGYTFTNTAIMAGTGIGITALASMVMSPITSGISYVFNPNKNYEHVVIFMRSQTSMEQMRALMYQYAQLSIHGKADRAYYLDALASTFNEYNDQVKKLLGYMLLKAGMFNKLGKQEKSQQAIIIEKFILDATNTCAQEVNKIVQGNNQDELIQLPEMLKQYSESVDNEIQRFLLLEDHPEQRELNPGSGMNSQEEMLKLMLQQM